MNIEPQSVLYLAVFLAVILGFGLLITIFIYYSDFIVSKQKARHAH